MTMNANTRQGKVVLLGFGMQGKAALYDLVHNSPAREIIVADNHPDLVSMIRSYPADRVRSVSLDAGDRNSLAALLAGADVAVESLPPRFALGVGKIAAEVGCNLVSSMYYLNPGERDPQRIASIRRDLADLDQKAREKGCTILTEFGMDPGIDLVLGAKALEEFDRVDEFHSYGAGFPAPKAADNPLSYKFTWSVEGVIRSYLRPGTLVRNGEVVKVLPDEMFAAHNRHVLDLEELGSPIECFPNGNSEHYAELFGLKGTVREMGRYSCRLPGHCEFWRRMAQCGFLNEAPIKVGDAQVSPVQFVATLLGSQEQFYFKKDEQDVAFIRIDVRGLKKGQKKQVVYQLIDRRDLETGFTAMQRTVGFTMSLGARLMLEGKLDKHGLLLPMDVPFELVDDGLRRHGMTVTRSETDWNGHPEGGHER
ncbi:MAG: saccharopine dehydrogenase [Deltaproteobacteria bacterium]|nr:MAG: saccharopine dehydrogenase [Deltaproteobacteria bacterium]